MREPPKATYLRFEDDPELEMEYFVAEQLGMTVGELRARMSSEEFMGWAVYFGRKAQRRELANGG